LPHGSASIEKEILMDEKIFIKSFEEKIDKFHESLDFFKHQSRQKAQWYLLVVYQECDRMNNLSKEGSEKFSDYASGLQYALYWTDSLKEDNFYPPKSIDLIIYKEAEEFFKCAINYKRVIAPFTLYWNGAASVEIINENKVRFYRTGEQQKFDVLEFLLYQHPTKGLLGAEPRVPKEIGDAGIKELLKVIKTVKSYGKNGFLYVVNSQNIKTILNGFKNMDLKFDLTDESWSFSDFSYSELKAIFSCLRSISLIHLACHFRASVLKNGVPAAAFLITKTKQEWIDVIFKSTGVSEEKIIKILEIFKYDKNFKKRDIVFQPFVEVAKDLLTIAPSLVGYLKLEVIFLALTAKLFKNEFDKKSGDFENIMIKDFLNFFVDGKFIVSQKRQLGIEILPDVDVAIYDKVTNTILICECKFVIPPIGVREVLNRNEREKKGIDQLKLIMTYAEKNLDIFLKRIFPTEDIVKPKIYYCALFKGYYGSSNSIENKIPVLEINHFEKLLNQHQDFYVFCEFIQSFSYLPKLREDFEPMEMDIAFGERSINWEGAYINVS
jgi:hypothetical protein